MISRIKIHSIEDIQKDIVFFLVQVAPDFPPKPPHTERATTMERVFLTQSATLHQRLRKKFPISFNKQCTAISAFAVAKLCRVPKQVSRTYLDQIVTDGDKYYLTCVKSRALHMIHLSCEDLVRSYTVNGFTLSFDVAQVGEGQFKDSAPNIIASTLTSGVQENSVKPIGEFGFVFVGHGKTVSCVPLGDHKYWVFNSHCVDANNRLCLNNRKGSARLFTCLGEDATARCLLADQILDNSVWQIYALYLTDKYIPS